LKGKGEKKGFHLFDLPIVSSVNSLFFYLHFPSRAFGKERGSLRINSSKIFLEENFREFKSRLYMRCYPNILLQNTRGDASDFYSKYFLWLLSEVVFEGKKIRLSTIEGKTYKKILPFLHNTTQRCLSYGGS